MKDANWLDRREGFEKIDKLGREKEPFLFIISYDKKKIFVETLNSLDDDILYKLESKRNYPIHQRHRDYRFDKFPISLKQYQKSMDSVIEEIRSGNTYLLNLTFRTAIETDLTLREIFDYSRAKFKLYFKDQFICFSPERFVEIENDTISAYPMKGTIEASLPDAEEQILSNPKEMAEHVMIVDLMRNDLGIVANDIRVEKFRYIDKIRAGKKELLQVSSKISGKLSSESRNNIGKLLDSLTPAGSITGTPKKRTMEIIENIEDYNRGFYTGIFGIFDGDGLRSAVMIRFIEDCGGKLFYKSGGGITIDSGAQSEYEELVDKIYLPF